MLRIGLGSFLLAQGAYLTYFGIAFNGTDTTFMSWGIALLATGMVILASLYKNWSYPLGALVYISTFPLFLGFMIANTLFVIIQIPILCSFATLILLREYDTLGSLDTLRKQKLNI